MKNNVKNTDFQGENRVFVGIVSRLQYYTSCYIMNLLRIVVVVVKLARGLKFAPLLVGIQPPLLVELIYSAMVNAMLQASAVQIARGANDSIPTPVITKNYSQIMVTVVSV